MIGCDSDPLRGPPLGCCVRSDVTCIVASSQVESECETVGMRRRRSQAEVAVLLSFCEFVNGIESCTSSSGSRESRPRCGYDGSCR